MVLSLNCISSIDLLFKSPWDLNNRSIGDILFKSLGDQKEKCTKPSNIYIIGIK